MKLTGNLLIYFQPNLLVSDENRAEFNGHAMKTAVGEITAKLSNAEIS